MKYRDGYKYQLAEPEVFKTSFRPLKEIRIPRVVLLQDGTMHVAEGYAWDGASGIIDRKTNITASCGHDALYNLMRLGQLDHKKWAIADEDFCTWLKNAGAWDITVNIDRWGLRQCNGKYAHPKNRKKVHCV
jgi:hypothetical protein